MHALIMDDHEFVTTGLRTTLNECFSDLEVSAANCSEDALRILTDHEVDIAVFSASESHVRIRKCLSYGV